MALWFAEVSTLLSPFCPSECSPYGFFSLCLRDMSKSEVARLRLLYGLIREHVQAVKRGIAEVDPTSNPLLDPRSVSLTVNNSLSIRFFFNMHSTNASSF